MTTTAQQRAQPADKLSLSLETATKVIATGAILLYACGFLITSIYHSQFGIIQSSPFSPRIISAGGWFLMMLLIQIGTIIHFMGGKRIPWLDLLRYVFPFWIACCTLSLFPAMLFYFGTGGTYSFEWKQVTATAILLAVFTSPQLGRLSKRAVAAISVGFAILLVGWAIRNLAQGGFCYSALPLWFFCVGIMTMLELMSYDPPKILDPRWIRTFFAALFMLFLFAGAFYPHLRSSWGGGAPVPITIYFTKESVIQPNSTIHAMLLDEDDDGYYIKGETDKIAIFTPRSSVALIVFSEASNASDLLRPPPQALVPSAQH